jgi:pyruvate/2-oxoglutarate dehydrogenase complex dihydrolipoamide dehydrogenase (E3) component
VEIMVVVLLAILRKLVVIDLRSCVPSALVLEDARTEQSIRHVAAQSQRRVEKSAAKLAHVETRKEELAEELAEECAEEA